MPIRVSGKGCLVVDYCLVENEKIAVAIDKVCTDPAVGRAMERLWQKRFT